MNAGVSRRKNGIGKTLRIVWGRSSTAQGAGKIGEQIEYWRKLRKRKDKACETNWLEIDLFPRRARSVSACLTCGMALCKKNKRGDAVMRASRILVWQEDKKEK